MLNLSSKTLMFDIIIRNGAYNSDSSPVILSTTCMRSYDHVLAMRFFLKILSGNYSRSYISNVESPVYVVIFLSPNISEFRSVWQILNSQPSGQ